MDDSWESLGEPETLPGGLGEPETAMDIPQCRVSSLQHPRAARRTVWEPL